MKQLNRWASKHESIIVWDLSHAVGAVAIDFKETETMIALGCTYKYMNGGPGAPAFLYINEEWHSKLLNPIQGWFGHQRPFDFSKKYEAANSIKRFASGTPAILSLLGMEAGIDITLEAGIKLLQEKSIQQSEAFIKECDPRISTSRIFNRKSIRSSQKRISCYHFTLCFMANMSSTYCGER